MFVARQLAVAEEDAEIGEGEVGGTVAAAFALPDAGQWAGEYVHGCVALSFGGALLTAVTGSWGGMRRMNLQCTAAGNLGLSMTYPCMHPCTSLRSRYRDCCLDSMNLRYHGSMRKR